jgi:protein-tyrosine phosphatase
MSPPEPFHVLAVCVGNVCRSPVMERLLSERLPWASVESAGVSAMVGSDMHPESRHNLGELGGDVQAFEARQLSRAMLNRADLILTADTYIRGRVLEEQPTALRRTFALREFSIVAQAVPHEIGGAAELVRWAGNHRSLAGGRRVDIIDPIGRSDDTHARVAHLIDEHTRLVADALNDARDRTGRDRVS